MGFSLSDLDPSKVLKSFFKNPFDVIGDIATDLYHTAEKVAKITFRETFRLLGITGENVLQGNISSQLLSKDSKASKNLLISEIIKKQNGSITSQQYIMHLLIAGKFIFNKAYSYGSTKYSKGLPIYYIIDTIDTKEEEEDNALAIAKALVQSDEEIIIDEVGLRPITEEEYKYSYLLAYYHYDPNTNTVEYSGKRLSVTDNTTITSSFSSAYGFLRKITMKGAEYNTITYTANRNVSTDIIPSAIPGKDEVTTTSTLTYYFFEEGALLETRSIVENKVFSLVDTGTGVNINNTETNVLSGSFNTPIEKFFSIEEGETTISITDTYTYEEEVTTTEQVQIGEDEEGNPIYEDQEVTEIVTTYYSKVTTGINKNFRIENIRTDRIIIAYVKWFGYASSKYYLQGEEPLLGTTGFSYPGTERVIGIKDIKDITQNFPGFGDYTYIYPHDIFVDNTEFTVIRFHKEGFPSFIYTFCYNANFDGLSKYKYIPTLSSLLSSYYEYQTQYTFPIIPLKRDGIWLDSYTDSFKEEVLDLMKTVNITSDSLLDELKSNVEGDNVTDVFLHFAVHPSEINKNEIVGRYLWLLLESIEEKIIPLPTGADRYLGFTLQDERYNCSIVWKYTSTADAVQSADFTYNIFVDYYVNKGLIVQYYDGTRIYSKVMKDCSFTSYITRDNETVISEKAITDKGFHIPLIQEYIDMLTPYEQIEILSCSMSISCFASEWIHLEYYETEKFMGFVTFVSLSIMVVSLGMASIESGALIALAKTTIQVTLSYGLKKALEYIYKQTDNDLFRVLATATAIATTMYTGQELFDLDIVSMTTISSATDIIQASMEINLQYKSQLLEEEQKRFTEAYTERTDLLEDMYEELETGLDPYSIMKINTSTSSYIPSLLSADSYYSIALGELDRNYDIRYSTGIDGYYDKKLRIGII
jgi:hypothetical protein